MSPACGDASTAAPEASARASVPWPAWQITSAQPGIVRAYEIHSTSRVLARDRQRLGRQPPVPGRQHPDRLAGEPCDRGTEQPVVGILCC